MASQHGDNPGGEVPEGGDPLLVRPFLLRDQDLPGPAASGATWPSAGDGEYREIRSHRVTAPAAASGPAATAARRRRGTYALAGAGAAAVLGLAAVGYGALRPAPDRDDVPIPSGALPPLPSVAPSSAPGTASAARPPATTTAGSARTSPRTTSPSAAATSSTAAPAPPVSAPPTTPGGGTMALQPGSDALAPPAPPAAARVGRIAGDGNLCLDLNGGVPVDDNHVQVFACNDTAAQRWTLAPDGTLQVVGKCAQVVGDATVHIVTCDGRTTAQWRASANGALVNLADGRCLTDPDSGTRSGAGVRVEQCRGAGNQEWSLP